MVVVVVDARRGDDEWTEVFGKLWSRELVGAGAGAFLAGCCVFSSSSKHEKGEKNRGRVLSKVWTARLPGIR